MLKRSPTQASTSSLSATRVGSGVRHFAPPPLPGSEFDPAGDAEILHRAMFEGQVDEKSLMSVLAHRTPPELYHISQAYSDRFQTRLPSDIEAKTSGNFGKLARACTMHPAEYDAWCLDRAMKGTLGADKEAIVEILVGRPNVEIKAIKLAYEISFGQSLASAVEAQTSGDSKQFLGMVLEANRDENTVQRDVAADAEALYKAGEGKFGTDNATFIRILGTRSEKHMKAVIEAYAKQYKSTLQKAIESEFSGLNSGTIKTALLAVVRMATSKAEFFADLLESSMSGMGTKDDKFIRTLVRLRYPPIMHAVKTAYEAKYKKHLVKRMEEESTFKGAYRELAWGLVGEE
ncbi:Annexin [Gonapodya prolifera JEL478]|uniref:Annexin n=1 Tax=Gonapodya prolifera (strain JEL478) TaxID=1344416 RepID=A0A139A901_GONPJ|nr:Annexin [Gonapodya prolifera JEL478]|eukprot:KXS13184.1 Annexin [Gonapodya prolifera JEL478]